MTLEEVRTHDRDVLTPAEVASVLKVDQQSLRVAARNHPERLGFPICRMGSRIIIPREPFLKFMTGGDSDNGKSV